MAALQPRPAFPAADAAVVQRHGASAGSDAALDTDWERRTRNRSPSARWIGWRLRVLVLAALVGCLAMFVLIRALAQQPVLDQSLVVDDSGALHLAGQSPQPMLEALIDAQGQAQPIDRLLLQRSSRWLFNDAQHDSHVRQHDLLAQALLRGQLEVVDSNGQRHTLAAVPRSAFGLGWQFWILSTLALLLYLVAMVVVMARPGQRNTLFLLMALCQAGNLMFLAVLSTPSLGWPEGFMRWERDARMAFDLATAGALVHVSNLHPRLLPDGLRRAALAWVLLGGVFVCAVSLRVPSAWWLTQAALITAGLWSVAQLSWMQRRQPHPLAVILLRFASSTIVTLLLLTGVVLMAGPAIDPRGRWSRPHRRCGPSSCPCC